MQMVHVFIAANKFSSEEKMDKYIQPEYDDNGERIDSQFIKEVQLENFEPMCIEAVYEEQNLPLHILLEGASYWEKWIEKLPKNIECNSAICVYTPNVVRKPEDSSMQFCGAYKYEI